ncbi:conjugal transfer transcriptional regulator TraJ [Azohydromonas lata]|uniref:Conjugal transfer transcriptional regulator TraJ n=1 Tax=Azohydromonas lata TaxID=45677 RepID=A0ABU5IK74_9BURK|nr:conjugal transfer transcriptional regulator TraJ [Azohydromonas lata]MDZ5459300.1 conjugal transfer transcriptional regulator TraJ [Azohydromonas lata]
MDSRRTVTRKGSPPIKVYCLPEERARIEANAKQARLSVARYLREVGQGYKLDSRLDLESVRELAKVNGDLGRLGGLLKLWLVKDARTASFSEATIARLLERIEVQQQELGRLMGAIVRPRAAQAPSPHGPGVKPLNT